MTAKIALIHGDFFLHPVMTADIIITDPCYGTTNCAWNVPFNFTDFWSRADAASGGRVISFSQSPFDKAFSASNIKNLKYEWIWHKTQATGHLNANRMPLKAHENILVFYKKNPVYNPIKTQGHKRKTSVKRYDNAPVYRKQKFSPISYDSTERYPTSVLTFASDKQRQNFHPTQKPLALMEYLVRTYTNEGDTVMDPFMGSGTTGLACIRLGRNFIGFEKEKGFFEVARQRLEGAA